MHGGKGSRPRDGTEYSAVLLKLCGFFQESLSCHLLEENGATSLQLVGDLELGRERAKLTLARLMSP